MIDSVASLDNQQLKRFTNNIISLAMHQWVKGLHWRCLGKNWSSSQLRNIPWLLYSIRPTETQYWEFQVSCIQRVDDVPVFNFITFISSLCCLYMRLVKISTTSQHQILSKPSKLSTCELLSLWTFYRNCWWIMIVYSTEVEVSFTCDQGWFPLWYFPPSGFQIQLIESG